MNCQNSTLEGHPNVAVQCCGDSTFVLEDGIVKSLLPYRHPNCPQLDIIVEEADKQSTVGPILVAIFSVVGAIATIGFCAFKARACWRKWKSHVADPVEAEAAEDSV